MTAVEMISFCLYDCCGDRIVLLHDCYGDHFFLHHVPANYCTSIGIELAIGEFCSVLGQRTHPYTTQSDTSGKRLRPVSVVEKGGCIHQSAFCATRDDFSLDNLCRRHRHIAAFSYHVPH